MLINPIPLSWKVIGVIIASGVLVGGADLYRRHVYQSGYDAAVSERAGRDSVALLRRTEENAVVAAIDSKINFNITKVKNEELAPVRERIVTQRVYVGSAICGPATADAEKVSGGGDGASPPGRLVRADVERDLIALKLAVETDLATARACQSAAREKGLVD